MSNAHPIHGRPPHKPRLIWRQLSKDSWFSDTSGLEILIEVIEYPVGKRYSLVGGGRRIWEFTYKWQAKFCAELMVMSRWHPIFPYDG